MPYQHSSKTSAESLPAYFESLHKEQLHELIDRLLNDEPQAVELCVAFIEAETPGCWHGRARAKIARRLKHCTLTPQQQRRLVQAIMQRLVSGRFSEQFKDQIRLVLHLDPAEAFKTAGSCLDHEKEYVRRYAAWILACERKP